jgi:pimeloyl-ACP methyl ester carboxylesterase
MSSNCASKSVRSADGTRIAFDRLGDGPPVILVEAALHYRDLSSFGGLLPLLSREFTVYAYDRRGRGESADTTPYVPDREVEDLEALLAEAGDRRTSTGTRREPSSPCVQPLTAFRLVGWPSLSHPSRTTAPSLQSPI